jgi:hypothetical protein
MSDDPFSRFRPFKTTKWITESTPTTDESWKDRIFNALSKPIPAAPEFPVFDVDKVMQFMTTAQPVCIGTTVPRDIGQGDEETLKQIQDDVIRDGKRIDLGTAFLMRHPTDPKTLLVVEKPKPFEFIPQIKWDEPRDPLRYRHTMDYGIFPEKQWPPCTMLFSDPGDGKFLGGWRRYGTKQRPVRANKRRRLARRYPIPNCQQRARKRLSWKPPQTHKDTAHG